MLNHEIIVADCLFLDVGVRLGKEILREIILNKCYEIFLLLTYMMNVLDVPTNLGHSNGDLGAFLP